MATTSASTNTTATPTASAPSGATATGQPQGLVPEASSAGAATRATSVGSLPSQQTTMLKDIAGLALQYVNPVNPGQVTQAQQQVLSAWEQNANTDYSQYMLNQGLSGVAQNPSALFNEEALAAQAQWSSEDVKSALNTLGLSASDWDEYEKLEAQKKKSLFGEIFGAAELVAGIAVSFTGVGAAVGVPLAAAGANELTNSSGGI